MPEVIKVITVMTDHGSISFTPSDKAQAELVKLNQWDEQRICDHLADMFRHELRSIDTMHLTRESIDELLHPEVTDGARDYDIPQQ